MRQPSLLFLALCLSFSSAKKCRNGQEIKLVGPVNVDEELGFLLHDGEFYFEEAYFKEGGSYYICPCDQKPCIRSCKADYARVTKLSLPKRGMKLNVTKDNEVHSVDLYNYFAVLKEGECWSAHFLDGDEEDAHTILVDGSIKFTNSLPGYPSTFDMQNYCILSDENQKVRVISCATSEKPEIEESQTQEPSTIEAFPSSTTKTSKTKSSEMKQTTKRSKFFLLMMYSE
ncbi:uncharacterized protein LOC132202412 [Neocloeon triangulifer]|uniref:uncharacterized protein LOC132202412 n=1 Tax=Neocloeon triangulifer TaxID=2078957 RepID=UPI00286EEB7F|nr:uncharacterized protein LOC132202412 [Neocloeon triangulifer]